MPSTVRHLVVGGGPQGVSGPVTALREFASRVDQFEDPFDDWVDPVLKPLGHSVRDVFADSRQPFVSAFPDRVGRCE